MFVNLVFFFLSHRKKSLSSLALSAYLTYVTLPWNKIMKGEFPLGRRGRGVRVISLSVS